MRTPLVIAVVVAAACGKAPDAAQPSTGSATSTAPGPAVPDAAPGIDAPVAAAEDHAASALAMYEARNYVEPTELAYSRKLGLVIYPACRGGEGPGERCTLIGLGKDGKDVALAADQTVSWERHGSDDPAGRAAAVKALTTTLDALDTFRLDRTPWGRGFAMDVPGFGHIEYDGKGDALIATAGSKTSRAHVEWGERGGPVNVFTAAASPVAVVQLRVNPASGGKEGYIVFIMLVVLDRP